MKGDPTRAIMFELENSSLCRVRFALSVNIDLKSYRWRQRLSRSRPLQHLQIT